MRLRLPDFNWAYPCCVVQEWWVGLGCLFLHMSEVVSAFLLLCKACNCFAEIVSGDGILGILLAEFGEHIAAFSESVEMVQGLGFASQGLVGFGAFWEGSKVTESCFPLFDLEKGLSSVELKVMDLLLCRGRLQGFGVTISLVSSAYYPMIYWGYLPFSGRIESVALELLVSKVNPIGSHPRFKIRLLLSPDRWDHLVRHLDEQDVGNMIDSDPVLFI